MAEVFRAHLLGAEGFSRAVAIKRVLPGFSSDPGFGEMFVREARLASLLAHPNVVPVLDFDRDDEGHFFIVMELVDGKDLRAIADHSPLPTSVTTFIITELLRALDYAHRLEHDGRPLRLVHRDVTPHNVLVSWQGSVKLSDFGIAKALAEAPVTRTGVVKGKAAYLSPEQAKAGPIDGRSDLFAVGVVLHELLTGERLFGVKEGAPDMVVVRRVLNLDIPRPREHDPTISSALEAVCLRLLSREPDDRFPSAQRALEAVLLCPEVSPRGQLDLITLMQQRFGDDAPPGSFSSPDTPLPLTPLASLESHPTELDTPNDPIIDPMIATAPADPPSASSAPTKRPSSGLKRTVRVDVGAHLERIARATSDPDTESPADIPAERRPRADEQRTIAVISKPDTELPPPSAPDYDPGTSVPSYPPGAMRPRRWPWYVAIALLVGVGVWAVVQLTTPVEPSLAPTVEPLRIDPIDER